MEVARPLTEDMKYFSDFYKPCTDLEAGWCNVPNKSCFDPTEMMIVAYHNKNVSYIIILIYANKRSIQKVTVSNDSNSIDGMLVNLFLV